MRGKCSALGYRAIGLSRPAFRASFFHESTLHKTSFHESTRATVYTCLRAVRIRLKALVTGLFTGDERIAGEEKTQRPVSGFGDSDTGRDLNITGAKVVVAEP